MSVLLSERGQRKVDAKLRISHSVDLQQKYRSRFPLPARLVSSVLTVHVKMPGYILQNGCQTNNENGVKSSASSLGYGSVLVTGT